MGRPQLASARPGETVAVRKHGRRSGVVERLPGTNGLQVQYGLWPLPERAALEASRRERKPNALG